MTCSARCARVLRGMLCSPHVPLAGRVVSGVAGCHTRSLSQNGCPRGKTPGRLTGGFPVSRTVSREVERGGIANAIGRVLADPQASPRENLQSPEIGHLDFDGVAIGVCRAAVLQRVRLERLPL